MFYRTQNSSVSKQIEIKNTMKKRKSSYFEHIHILCIQIIYHSSVSSFGFKFVYKIFVMCPNDVYAYSRFYTSIKIKNQKKCYRSKED